MTVAYRDVLVILRPYPAGISDAAVDHAASMAAALGARTSAIACAVSPKSPPRLFGDGLIDVSGLVAEEARRSEDDAKRLVALFGQAMAKKGATLGDQLCLVRPSAEVPAVLAQHARLHDLSVLPRPTGESVSPFDAQWYAEAVLFDSGQPTLILPERPARDPVALDTVVVAWDKSGPAARAIADAIPLLAKAKAVRLLTVRGEKPIADDPPAAAMAQRLERHGVAVALDEVLAGGRAIGEVLTAQVRSCAADLLVMGAYGQSRLREFLLGGATRSLLGEPPCPLFMSH